ncbi:aminotransferase class I/II-fold pyridoxal phosphate-dependent enzyme [Shigella flexneri]
MLTVTSASSSSRRHVLLQRPDQRAGAALREEFGVYAVASGRVNVAGMTPDNMAPLCKAIVAVL